MNTRGKFFFYFNEVYEKKRIYIILEKLKILEKFTKNKKLQN